MEDLSGFDFVRRDYASPVAHDVPSERWDRPSALAGLEFDLPRQVELYQSLQAHWADAPAGKGMFGDEDARVLHGIVRMLDPQLTIELGSGASTPIIRAATRHEHRVYDPYPNDAVRATDDIEVTRLAAQDLDLSVFEKLGDGDVLFVDTSHVVKTGGDVNWIVLDVLPSLRPGVWIHFHDIFLPWNYPRQWSRTLRLHWSEQYLLQAFLAYNPNFRVELALYALTRAELIAPLQPAPGSFWISKT